jgi:hypothetical protein
MLWYLFQAGQQATKHNHTHVSGHLTPTWLQHLSTTRSFVDHRKPAPGSWPQQLSSHQLLLFRRVCPDVPSVWRVITGRRSARRGSPAAARVRLADVVRRCPYVHTCCCLRPGRGTARASNAMLGKQQIEGAREGKYSYYWGTQRRLAASSSYNAV